MVTLPGTDESKTIDRELRSAVLEALAYSDVFDFPMTAEEVWRGLPVVTVLAAVRDALDASALVEPLDPVGESYYALRGRANLAEVRRRRQRASAALWQRGRRYGRMISTLPFVRMVTVTGALAFDNSEDGDDIDFLIVTAPDRVWLVRAMTMAIVRLAALRGVTLCPNYLLAEDSLELTERDLYSARELLQMVPLSGRGTYARMLAENDWWKDLLPNAVPAGHVTFPRSRLGGILEAVIPARLADRLDRWVFASKGRELREQARGGDEAAFDRSRCKGHFEGHRARTVEGTATRLAQLGAAR